MVTTTEDSRSAAIARFYNAYCDWGEGDPLPTAVYDLQSGLAGISFALLCHYGLTKNADLLDASERFIDFASSHLDALEIQHEGKLDIYPSSLFYSPAGVWMANSVIKSHLNDTKAVIDALERFVVVASRPNPENDIIWGSAGLLLGCVEIIESIAKVDVICGDICRLADEIYATLSEYLEALRPFESADSHNVTFSHGWPGVMYAVFRYALTANAKLPSSLPRLLEALGALAIDDNAGKRWPRLSYCSEGNDIKWCWPTWCNGTSGMVYVWTAAFDAYKNSQFLDLAKGAAFYSGQTINKTPFYSTVCCGLAGQAYALARVSRSSSESMWLKRCGEFSQLIGKIAERPSPKTRPHSLMQGTVGELVLHAQVLHGVVPAMPLMERL